MQLFSFATFSPTDRNSNLTMFHQRPGEHSTKTVRRLLRRVAIPQSVEHRLLILVNELELAKSQLKAHLAERKTQITQLQAHAASQSGAHTLELTQARTSHAMGTKALKKELAHAHADHELKIQSLEDELEQARRGYSGDDDLVKLYHAGSAVITKQAAEIKKLRAEGQHEKDEQERQTKDFTAKMDEKDEEKAVLVEAVEQLEGRLASLTTESMDNEEDLKGQVADVRGQWKAAASRSSKLESEVLADNKTIDNLRRRESAGGEKADLLNRLHRVEQHCEGYRSTATDQQKLIEKLSKENAKLVGELGKMPLHYK
jgi:chromosome segregation ATPase